MTDAAGNTTTTVYDAHFDQPSVVTDALGKTACYRYDIRGRKVAEFGTAIQPALFGYDDADRMTSLTTFRVDAEEIVTDPSERTDGDTTTWAYHDATGLETAKTYADNSCISKVYGAFGQLATITNARGIVQPRTYNTATGQLTGISFSDDTEAQSFAYNVQGQLVQVTDAAGIRTFSFNAYGEQVQDSVSVNGTAFPIVEELDSFGRSTGYVLKRDNAAMQTASHCYDSLGRLNSASFLHGGVAKQFSFERLAGTDLMQNIVCPNGITKTYGYEAQRDLVTNINDKRGATDVVLRGYTYDELGRPTARTYARQGTTRNDTFTHNDRSELTGATMGNDLFSYDYDNVGNRKVSTEKGETTVYDSNELNQYTAENEFEPQFDADGNQTLVKTGTGIWEVTYNALNRPTCFTRTNADDTVTTVTAAYDYMGRRVFKKVEENGTTMLYQRYLYRGYLQIAAHDLTRSTLNALWFITWDPTEPIATRPLAIQKDGTWYTYGLDLTKNVMELYTSNGFISTTYTYTPYGESTAIGIAEQPIQWSSEFEDKETNLICYNYRHYNLFSGRWLCRDMFKDEIIYNLYLYADNQPVSIFDYLGLEVEWHHLIPQEFENTITDLLKKGGEKIDIHDAKYGYFLDTAQHTKVGGIHSLGWNKDWANWLKQYEDGKTLTVKCINKRLREMLKNPKYAIILKKGKKVKIGYKEWKNMKGIVKQRLKKKIEKQIEKRVAKATAKGTAKAIPGLNVAMSIGFGIFDFCSGESLADSVCSNIPYVGTAYEIAKIYDEYNNMDALIDQELLNESEPLDISVFEV